MLEDAPNRFEEEKRAAIARMGADGEFQNVSRDWMTRSIEHRYSYNFTWLGRPVIQYPQDLLAVQELIFQIRPRTIIETGVAHGGSLIFSASILELLGGPGKVIGIDIDIRPHNRKALEEHPLYHRISLLEGSSVAPEIVARVQELVDEDGPVLVCLDSNHSHAHVLEELRLYAPLVSVGSYLVVFDTVVEFLPEECSSGRPWGPGDNPWTAVQEFLQGRDDFAVDRQQDDRLSLSVAPGGYLRRLR